MKLPLFGKNNFGYLMNWYKSVRPENNHYVRMF